MKTYFATIASNQPKGPGYWEIKASSEVKAREAVSKALDNRYSMLYDNLEEIHPLDRTRHGLITGE